jgi:hypothetical protein
MRAKACGMAILLVSAGTPIQTHGYQVGAQTSMRAELAIRSGGKRVGAASYTHKLLADGSKIVQVQLTFGTLEGQRTLVRSESRYDPKGAPVRMYHQTYAETTRSRRTVVATFDPFGAHVVEVDWENRRVLEVPLPPNFPREDASQFWFIRDQPAAGAASRCYRFDVRKLEWNLEETLYAGTRTKAIGSALVAAHELRAASGLAWVDSSGLPLRLEREGFVLERE